MFHAHSWNYSNWCGRFMWTVAQDDRSEPNGRNVRRVLRCRLPSDYTTGSSYDLIHVGPGPPVAAHRVQESAWYRAGAPNQFFTELYNQGYLSYPGFEHIFNEPTALFRRDMQRDINPSSVHGGFRQSRDHWPENEQAMLGNPGFERYGSHPWHSPFLIENGRIRPVTRPPNFPNTPPPPSSPPPPSPPPPPPPPFFLPPSGGTSNEGDHDTGWNSTMNNLTRLVSAA